MQTLTPPPKYRLIGHRGVAGLRPENTRCSFEYAAELGLNWVEFDVQLTSDDQWIVLHDAELERTTNGHGFASKMTLAELTKLEAGLWHNPPYSQQYLLSLTETINLAANLDLQCNIEIKGAEINPTKHAKLMADFLATHFPENKLASLISSFDLPCIIALRNLLPQLPISYLVDYFTVETIAIAKRHNFTSINCDVKNITIADVKAATATNIPVMLYTVNDLATANHWLQQGVQALFTDRPDLLRPD